ncbi:phospholipase D family protein [Yersinia enterocolitica]
MRKLLFITVIIASPSYSTTQVEITEQDCQPTHEVAFSPNRGSLQLILQEINNAQSNILIAAYSFTSQAIVDALVAAHDRGVAVSIVVNKGSINGVGAKARDIEAKGVQIRANDKYRIMHNKFIVIDDHTVETGSFNYSAAAVNRNAENVIVVKCAPAVTSSYKDEFQRLWDESVDLPS